MGSKRPAERQAEGPLGQKKTKFEELLGHAGSQVSTPLHHDSTQQPLLQSLS